MQETANIYSTSNMLQHINHHSEHSSLPPEQKLPKGQTTLMSGFASPLTHNNARAQENTRVTGYFIAKVLRPFSVVENEGFWLLINTLEPRCRILSSQCFSQLLVAKLYQKSKLMWLRFSEGADSVSTKTNGWKSRAMQSYYLVTITAHVISAEWELAGFVLQTWPLLESHTGANIAGALKEAVAEWQLEMQQHGFAVVTDITRNMNIVVRKAWHHTSSDLPTL